MDSRAHYAYVFHYNPQQFAGLSLTGFEAALTREGIPLAGAYPSLSCSPGPKTCSTSCERCRESASTPPASP
jgi:hypothetical protein